MIWKKKPEPEPKPEPECETSTGMIPLTFRDLRYLGKVTFPTSMPDATGDLCYAQGLALRWRGDELRATVAASKCVALEFRVPDVFNGVATYLAKLGHPERMETPNKAAIWGLAWDEIEPDVLWAASHIDYDTDTQWAKTLSRSRVDPATPEVLVKDGFWNFTSHCDKQTMGGVVAIPEPFRPYVSGKRLAVGFGGYQSIAATGPASMGPCLSAFDWPDTSATTIADQPLQGYRYGTNPANNPRQQRPIDYVNDFSDNSGFPQYPTEETGGFWTWCDNCAGCGVWIVHDNRWGFLTIGTMGSGRVWYGSTGDGTPSAVNCERMTHCWFLTDPEDLRRVASGEANEAEIQAAFEPVEFPTISYPMPGMPNGVRQIALSASWSDGILGILLSKAGSKMGSVNGPALLLYEVAPQVALPIPDPPSDLVVY